MASWQELATSPAAMVEASQAALKACGGVFQENPGVWLPSGMPEAAVVALNLQASQDESKDTVYLDALSSDEQVSCLRVAQEKQAKRAHPSSSS